MGNIHTILTMFIHQHTNYLKSTPCCFSRGKIHNINKNNDIYYCQTYTFSGYTDYINHAYDNNSNNYDNAIEIISELNDTINDCKKNNMIQSKFLFDLNENEFYTIL